MKYSTLPPGKYNEQDLIDYENYLSEWLHQKLIDTSASGFIIGLSGGVDSALLATILKKYFPKKYLVVTMHLNNPQIDLNCANELIALHKLNAIDWDLSNEFELFKSKLETESTLVLGNIKSRLRSLTLYALAQKHNYLVLGTSNYDEILLGYFTKFGDGACDLMPLSQLNKEQIFALGKINNVPQSILGKPPSAGLSLNQTDEDDMGIKYSEIDSFLIGNKINVSDINIINQRYDQTKHKRQMPDRPIPFMRFIK